MSGFDRAEIAKLIAAALELGDEDDERWEIVTALQDRGDDEVFAAACDLCLSPEPRSRVLGADILAQGRAKLKALREQTVPLLLDVFAHETDLDVVYSLCLAFHHLRAVEAVELVVRWAEHPDRDVRFGVVMALLCQEDERAISALTSLSGDVDHDVRNWATFGLGSQVETDTPAIRDALCARLTDTHDETRHEAIVGLARRGDRAAFEPLRRDLESGWVSSLLFEAAAEYRDPELFPQLVEIRATWPGDNWPLSVLARALEACRPPATDTSVDGAGVELRSDRGQASTTARQWGK
jgi:HEAT repeat protein